MGADDQQLSEISVSHFDTRPRRSLPPEGVCLGANYGTLGELSCAREGRDILDTRGDRGRPLLGRSQERSSDGRAFAPVLHQFDDGAVA